MNITHLSLLYERDAARERLKAMDPNTATARKLKAWIEDATRDLIAMERRGL